uniref:Uncharacterized protein n=1 Tax=Compsopogon caeruleus TaxID=31354 RepID=A0A1Z1XBF6_9RHOD|nr:hypothetical protein [Compsopogon caeruleus]ARX96168.1 hypothetical protein [Compsopogon caeruleus]
MIIINYKYSRKFKTFMSNKHVFYLLGNYYIYNKNIDKIKTNYNLKNIYFKSVNEIIRD